MLDPSAGPPACESSTHRVALPRASIDPPPNRGGLTDPRALCHAGSIEQAPGPVRNLIPFCDFMR